MIPVIPHEEETSDSTMETHSKLHDVPTSDKDTEVAMETEKSSIEGGAGGKEGMAVRSKGSRLDKGNNASVSMKPRTMVAKKYSRKKRKH